MTHWLIGYDKQTELVVHEVPVENPAAIMSFPPEDRDGVYCYPVEQDVARRHGGDKPGADYFLETYRDGDPGI